MGKLQRRMVRRFIYKTDEGYLVDWDMHLPSITKGERERHCRGVYPEKGEFHYCNRIISRHIPTLTIDGLTEYHKSNPHHYCPRCSEILLENMKKKAEADLKVIRKAKDSKRNQKDIKLSDEKWKWEEILRGRGKYARG